VRARQNIPPKTPIKFMVRGDAGSIGQLRPMGAYFESMAGASATAWGSEVQPPKNAASFSAGGVDVFVDLAEFIDVAAELEKKQKELARLEQGIAGKEKQLANENFVSRAPAAVLDKERAALEQLREQHAATLATIESLQAESGKR
jgi:valyl-tRNA synthetase